MNLKASPANIHSVVRGGYTLCEPCNNSTGRWYGANYAAWVYQAAAYVSRASGELTLSYPYHLLPLRVIKQIVCMFFSVNAPNFREVHPELVRFVLNKEIRRLPEGIRIYAGYLVSDRSRAAGVTGSLQLDERTGVPRVRTYSEVSFPPFSYILSINSPPPEHAMSDISFFAEYGYDDFATLQLSMPVLSIYTPFPGDFRNREAVLRESKSDAGSFDEY